MLRLKIAIRRGPVIAFVRKYRRECSGVLLLLAIGGMSGAMVPLAVAWGLNMGLLARPLNLPIVPASALLAVGGYLVVSLANAARTSLANRVGADASRDLRASS